MSVIKMSVKITSIPKSVIAYYTGEKIELSPSTQENIEKHWNGLDQKGKRFTREDLFSIKTVSFSEERCVISLGLSDYAHYLYTIYTNPKKEGCRVLFTAALIETKDHDYVLGEMAKNTSSPSRIQCPGGGLSRLNLDGNVFNLERNINMECEEEIGISIYSNLVKNFHPLYLKSGGKHNSLAVIWKVNLNITSKELLDHFSQHHQQLIKKGESPELHSLVFIANDECKIDQFIKNDTRPKVDYLEALLKIDCKKV